MLPLAFSLAHNTRPGHCSWHLHRRRCPNYCNRRLVGEAAVRPSDAASQSRAKACWNFGLGAVPNLKLISEKSHRNYLIIQQGCGVPYCARHGPEPESTVAAVEEEPEETRLGRALTRRCACFRPGWTAVLTSRELQA
ncbi:hypothetical protein BRADI_5g08727v3 [Brachypodium distachyon]|uniref:Uncharacterized protein n=1 Tax=Brachypodium distachyon TaxID=15368 RepID=A0A2K2CG20_BRADI|nr:hypothetical protein BRADI_5g08727v3 [Brachypodium distachyon]